MHGKNGALEQGLLVLPVSLQVASQSGPGIVGESLDGVVLLSGELRKLGRRRQTGVLVLNIGKDASIVRPEFLRNEHLGTWRSGVVHHWSSRLAQVRLAVLAYDQQEPWAFPKHWQHGNRVCAPSDLFGARRPDGAAFKPDDYLIAQTRQAL